ncbi:hypothetical protein LUZ60_015241 [Juncus effusus]|nr:hypothetical protein LUZ60_015241 [Juncus effusus]
MDETQKKPSFPFNGDVLPDVALECVLNCIDDPSDRHSISLVCRRWHRIDSLTRKHVTIAFCYSAEPARLRRRFRRLEALKLKGKPRASMYNLIQEDWGGYARPWTAEISAGGFDCLKAIHLRRMIVGDEDLELLVGSRGHVLLSLKLDKCSGFSTNGLRLVTRKCRCLRVLFMEESLITEHDTNWFHDLALTPNNSSLETLNFYMTDLHVSPDDLILLAKNCKSLISLKISDADVSNLIPFFLEAKSLIEFGGGFSNEQGEIDKFKNVVFPQKLSSLSLIFIGGDEMPFIFPFCRALKKLDLQYTVLNTEDHCQLIMRCPNLETLEVRNVIGDRGLEVVSQHCKKLKRLRIERGEDDQELEDENGKVSQIGLTAISIGCPNLEYIAVYASDISNSALESIGVYNKNLIDFRFVLLDKEERITELPLDNGVRALLQGCKKLRRFSFYVRPGGLSDIGLKYISEFSKNIRYMLLGNVGETDKGILDFSLGCPSLEKLELRSCCFSEKALAQAILRLCERNLRYVWVQGYRASFDGRNLFAMRREFWNIEFIPAPDETEEDNGSGIKSQAQVLAYYSFAGKRTDCPKYVMSLHPI